MTTTLIMVVMIYILLTAGYKGKDAVFANPKFFNLTIWHDRSRSSSYIKPEFCCQPILVFELDHLRWYTTINFLDLRQEYCCQQILISQLVHLRWCTAINLLNIRQDYCCEDIQIFLLNHIRMMMYKVWFIAVFWYLTRIQKDINILIRAYSVSPLRLGRVNS